MVDLQEIKATVSKKSVFEPMGADPLPHEIVSLEKMIKDTPETAPIFIKMDKYKDILHRVNGLKNSLGKVEEVIRVRKNMHEINMRTDEMLEKLFQEFSEATHEFKREFVIAKSMPFQSEEMKETEPNEHINKLTNEIIKLKDELDNLEI